MQVFAVPRDNLLSVVAMLFQSLNGLAVSTRQVFEFAFQPRDRALGFIQHLKCINVSLHIQLRRQQRPLSAIELVYPLLRVLDELREREAAAIVAFLEEVRVVLDFSRRHQWHVGASWLGAGMALIACSTRSHQHPTKAVPAA